MLANGKPELLVPASSLDVLKVAVMYGADAVYIGGEMYGLRAKAKNFSNEDIKAGIEFAHKYGKRVFITANITAHNRDLEGVRKYFEELKEIREGCVHPEKIGICLDTCHVFAAGYDIVEHLDEVLSEFDRVLGLSLLRAVHLNDSMMPFGSNKDRHAALGAGEIGFPALLRVLEHPALKGLPFYLETPFDDAGHAACCGKN